MTTITIYGYVFNGKKWKYKQKIIPIELGYEDAKKYSKGLFKRLLMDKSLSLEGIAISKIPDSEVTSKELHKNKVFAERKKGIHKYRTNEETLGSLESYIVYKTQQVLTVSQ